MRISAWAIRNPIPVVVLFIGLMIAGLIAYPTLAVKNFPDVTFPAVSVTVTQSGAAPGELETQVTRQVEDALASIPSVRNIQSSVTQGVSTTTIELEIGEDLQKKTDEVQTRIDQIRPNLPREIDEPLVQRVEFDSIPITTFAVSAPAMSDVDLSWFIDDIVSRALQAEKGVAQINRVGGVNREINVIIDPDRLAAHGLTASQVNNALRAADLDVPGGRVEVGGREQTVRVLAAANTLAALREMTIPTGGGRYVKLTDVADVGDGQGETRGFARLNGRPVVGFQVLKTRAASDIDVEDRAMARLDKLEKQYPGVTFTRIFTQVTETRDSFRATQHVLLEGMLLAALVVWFFLRDWRATLITAFAMPVSLIPTFFVIKMMGFSLNTVTLLGLTLVIGILIDDAIVEIENIEKRVKLGMRPYEAAMQGADAIGLAVVATTAAIVVVFAPVSFMTGMVGQFFREFGLTVCVAVLFSLLVARLLTPLMAAYLLSANIVHTERKPFEGFYRNALEWALDHRIVASIAGAIMFFASIFIIPLLPSGFQPPMDSDFLYVQIQGPPGATARDMETVVQRVTTVLKTDKDVTDVFAEVGSSGPSNPFAGGGGGGDLRAANINVLLKPKGRRHGDEIRADLRKKLREVPDARISFAEFGPGGGTGYQQILTSQDPVKLQATASELERQMRTLDVLADPHPSTPPVGPELIIRPRPAEAARLGVSADVIAQAARVATVGDIDANVAKLTAGERRIPIRIRLPADARADLERIKALRLPTASGGTTTLDAVADISFQAGPARIQRLNRQRQLTVEAELNGIQMGQAREAIMSLPIMKNMPEGVRPAEIGQQQAFTEMIVSFVIALFSGIMMIFGVLVLLFRSFFKPIVILAALPLAIGGAFMGLLLFNLSLSIPSLIGLLMLMGLAAKNSILLVEYAIEREREGLTQREALLEACRERARPIIMTSLAMAAGMLPTAFAIEKGSEFRQPMAVAVIGGLITSTLLSLVLVPAVYEFVDDFENWIKPKLARLVTPREALRGPVPDDRL
jgi:HAE1 family hydrophobic/amphiphilic exporter-1